MGLRYRNLNKDEEKIRLVSFAACFGYPESQQDHFITNTSRSTQADLTRCHLWHSSLSSLKTNGSADRLSLECSEIPQVNTPLSMKPQNLDYLVLSDAWGDPKETVDIEVDGVPFPVTAILRQL